MIPEFVDGLNLENKAHRCTLHDVRAKFGQGARAKLFGELEHLVGRGRNCGFLYALIGGSFATGKPEPHDLDITWFGPPGLSKANAPCGCADLMDQQQSRDRFGHDLQYISLYEQQSEWNEQLERWGRDLGFDVKTSTNRGTLLLELL